MNIGRDAVYIEFAGLVGGGARIRFFLLLDTCWVQIRRDGSKLEQMIVSK